MNGYQLTFYTEQNRKHGRQNVCDWLLDEASRLGIHGATVINAAEGIGHAGARHAAHMLSTADQPVQIVLALSEEEAETILNIVRAEKVHVFYTRFPIEFALIGDDEPPKPANYSSQSGQSDFGGNDLLP
jgi:PII-like signaling protein